MARPRRELAGPVRESVWDYPRPPRLEPSDRRVRILVGSETVVDTHDAVRVLETSHPPGWYVPFEAVSGSARLQPVSRTTVCEFKGRAVYWTIVTDSDGAEAAAWSYPEPTAGFEELRDRFTVYPGRVTACYVDNERVLPQQGGFYGGWITPDVAGPFTGGDGTWGW